MVGIGGCRARRWGEARGAEAQGLGRLQRRTARKACASVIERPDWSLPSNISTTTRQINQSKYIFGVALPQTTASSGF